MQPGLSWLARCSVCHAAGTHGCVETEGEDEKASQQEMMHEWETNEAKGNSLACNERRGRLLSPYIKSIVSLSLHYPATSYSTADNSSAHAK